MGGTGRYWWFTALLLMHSPGAFAAMDERCLGAPVSLQVLGSGGPEFSPGRASSSYLVRRGGEAVVMVDAGSGSRLRFAESGADFSDPRAILFTHLHVDHSADLPGLIKSSYFTDRRRPLRIYGPEGNRLLASARGFVHALFGGRDGAYPYLNDYLDGSESYRIEVETLPVEPREVRRLENLDGIALSTVPVHHGPLPALAWRVEIDGRSIVFSGDMNGDYHTLEKLAEGADLLVAHNAVPEGATGAARRLHMPPSVIGEIAAKAGVKRLVLSHRMGRTLGREGETLAAIRSRYDGPVEFADDLDCFVP